MRNVSRIGSILFPFSALFMASVIFATVVSAAHLVPEDHATIQAALDFAAPGDTILVAPGTYSGAGNMNLDFAGKDMALIGTEGSENTILHIEYEPGMWGQKNFVFDDGETPACLVRGFTLRNDLFHDVGGAIVCESGSSPAFEDIVVDGINSSGDATWSRASGLLCTGGSSPRFTGVSFRASGRSGVIEIQGGAPLFTDVEFVDNTGVTATVVIGGGASPVFTEVVFRGNGTWKPGGMIRIGEDCAPVFEDIVFKENQAGQGGVIYGGGSAIFVNCLFIDNTAVDYSVNAGHSAGGLGGALCLQNSTALFRECLFTGNRAEAYIELPPWYTGRAGRGGAVAISGGAPVFEFCTFHDNACEPWEGDVGGAIHAMDGADASFTACIFTGTDEGFAFWTESVDDTPDVTCSDIWGHVASVFGGECPDLLQTGDNITADPRYCNYGDDPFTLFHNSPCLPCGNACGVRMGAFDQGCVDTPVMLSGFDAVAESDAVILSWRTGEALSDPEFMLEAKQGDVARNVEWSQAGPGLFSARDEQAVREADDIIYRLFGRLAGEDWQPLGTLTVAPAAAPLSTALLAPYPNPFNPRVNIAFTLAEAGRARVSIHDITGRRVARLADATFAAGRHELIWEGGDDNGRVQASGIYFARLETAGATEQRRLVLLR